MIAKTKGHSLTMTRLSITATAALAIVLAACGGGGSAASSDRVEIQTATTEFAYAPKAWEIPSGKPIKIVLKNKGTVEHDFTIDALKLKVTVAAGKDAEKSFAAIAPGTYEVHCTVAGHKEAGMTGTLTVR